MKEEITLELGYGLLRLVEKTNGASLLEKIADLRTKYPDLPKVHIMDNINLNKNELSINGDRLSLEYYDSKTIADEEHINIIMYILETIAKTGTYFVNPSEKH